MIVLAYGLATAMPLVFLFLVYSQDFYQSGSRQLMAVCLAWGGVSVGLAFVVNELFFHQMLGYAPSEIIQLVAPIAEEVLKGLLIVLLVRQQRFTYFIDGAIYGFAIGIGFAIFENYFYIYTVGGNQSLGIVILRIISVNLIHAAATGWVGIAAGLARQRPPLRQVIVLLVGLVTAIVTHAIYNGVVSNQSASQAGSVVLILAIGLGMATLLAIGQVIRLGLKEQMRIIEAQLLVYEDQAEADDISYLADDVGRAELVTVLEASFDSETVEKILNYLTLQAQLGVQRQRVMELSAGERQEQVQLKIKTLEKQIETGKADLGNYYLMSLRQLFPVDSPLWRGAGEEAYL